ncbi:MAG TPA: PAS domain S-box protein, partial [Bacteroidota bacterium]
ITSWNRGAELMYGYTHEEAYGKSVAFLSPPDRVNEMSEILRQISAMQTILQLETELVRKDGRHVDVSVTFSPLKDAAGTLIGASTIARDITERKASEKALRQKTAELQKQAELLDNAHVFIKDMNNTILFWNKGSEQLYGWTKHEALGRSSEDLFKTRYPMNPKAIEHELLSRGEWQGELIHTKRNGDQIVVASFWVLHREEHGEPPVILEVNNDITELKRAENEIRQLNAELEIRVQKRTAQLEAANNELETFSYSVSHDLRAPLRAIDGFSREVLERYASALDADGKRYLHIIRTKTKTMGQLIDDLLAFSRVSRVELERTEVDMDKLVRMVVEELRKIENIPSLTMDIRHLEPVKGNLAMLRQVWSNLISNALKFSRKTPRPVIEIGSMPGDSETTYYIRDNGIGFDMAHADKLFGVFQRIHKQEEYEGTGVGLAIVQRIVHRHGGTIRAESTPNKGTTFSFTLPKEVGSV